MAKRHLLTTALAVGFLAAAAMLSANAGTAFGAFSFGSCRTSWGTED